MGKIPHTPEEMGKIPHTPEEMGKIPHTPEDKGSAPGMESAPATVGRATMDTIARELIYRLQQYIT